MPSKYWLLWSFAGAFCINISLTLGKIYQDAPFIKYYLIYGLSYMLFAAWVIPVGIGKSPTFAHLFFTQNGFISILGILTSLLIFKDSLTWYNYLGVMLASISIFLMYK